MKDQEHDSSELILVDLTPGLTEIAHAGSKRFGMPGRIVAATIWIQNGTELQELRFSDSDFCIGSEAVTSALVQLPIDFDRVLRAADDEKHARSS